MALHPCWPGDWGGGLPVRSRPVSDVGPVRWGLGEAIGGWLVAFSLVNMVAGIAYGVKGGGDPSLVSITASMVAYWTGLLGAAVLASRMKGHGSLREDFGLRIEAADILPGLLAGVASQVLITVLYLPFTLLKPDLDVSEEAERLLDPVQGMGLVVLAVFLVIGAPFVEELFFRGLLQRALTRRYGPGLAVAISSVAFGLLHLQPVQLLGLVVFGVVLGVLAQRSGRLGPGLVAHAAFNATTVVLLAVIR